MYEPSFPLQFSRGPTPCKLMLVAESWGEHEEKLMRPLVGSSGLELARMLYEAGIINENLPHKFLEPAQLDSWWQNQDIFMTNVLPLRPINNKVISLCDSKIQVGGKNYTHPALELGKYLRPEYLPELGRLSEEIKLCQPNLIIALGNVACWALLNRTAITSIRGTTSDCTLVPGVKVLPTFHPKAIIMQWQNRPIMLADLIKAKKEMEFPEIIRPQREIIVNPSLNEIKEYYLQLTDVCRPTRSGCDDLPRCPETTSKVGPPWRDDRSDVGAERQQEVSQGARLEAVPLNVAHTVAQMRARQAPEADAEVSNVGTVFSEAPTLREYGEQDGGQTPLIMSIDIETKGKQITMISFAFSKDRALVIPFYDESLPNGNYWQKAEDEVTAWMYVKKLLELPIPKLFQNGMYDLQYLFRAGFRPVNVIHDTMLLHHAILPEMKKGLGFLGSIYTNESSWKLLRRVRAKELSSKADE